MPTDDDGNGRKRVGTPSLGIQVLDSTCNVGRAEPVTVSQDQGVAAVELARRVAHTAVNEMLAAQHSQPRRPDPGKKYEWARWAVGILIVLLGAWWSAAAAFSERPTADQVEHMIDRSAETHETIEADVLRNEEQINAQSQQLSSIETMIRSIDSTISEIKQDLRRRKKR